MTARPSREPGAPPPAGRGNRRLPADWPGSWDQFQAHRARFLARLAADQVLREVAAVVARDERPTAAS